MTSLGENREYRVISRDYIEKVLKMIEADMKLNQDDRACLNRFKRVIKFKPTVIDDGSFSDHLGMCKSVLSDSGLSKTK